MAYKFTNYTGADIAELLDKVKNGYQAGTGLSLTNTTFSIDESWLKTRVEEIYKGTKTATYVTGITLSPSTSTISTANGTKQITATISPSGADNKTLTWTSSNTSIATVDSNGLVTAVASAGTNATTTITATATDGKGAKGTCTVTVNIPSSVVNVTSLGAIQSGTTTIDYNANTWVSAEITPSNATNKTINWSTSNSSVLNFNGSATTTSQSGATVTIYANNTDEDNTKSVTITATTADGSYQKTKTFTIGKHPSTTEVPSILYGTVQYNIGTMSNTEARTAYSYITNGFDEDTLKAALNQTATAPTIVDLKEYGNLGTVTGDIGGTKWTYLVMLIPNISNYNGVAGYEYDVNLKVDNEFSPSTTSKNSCNGEIIVTYNSINYRVYGKYNTTQSSYCELKAKS